MVLSSPRHPIDGEQGVGGRQHRSPALRIPEPPQRRGPGRLRRIHLVRAGTFGIGNGPGSTDMVEIGPLDPGQIVHIRTDPRKRGVFDLTKANTTTGPYLFGAQPSDEL